ncbi:hypothetical protein GCM10023237_69430 [Streptomyces coeruleoprunus]
MLGGVDQTEQDPDLEGAGGGSGGALPAVSVRALRGPVVRRLLALRREGKLTTTRVRSAADVLGVRERAVWRWLAAAEGDEAAARAPGERAAYPGRFTVTDEVRALLGLWRGNVAAVHRELTARADRGEGDPPPSIATLHRAIRRDLSPGERAGLAGGEGAARKHDVFLARPRGWRNQVWETDHVQAPVLVEVDGRARRPWIKWFTDCATNAVTGVAVTPVHPSRESVLAALRSAVLREEPYGPFGGLPEKVRVDRGKGLPVTDGDRCVRSPGRDGGGPARLHPPPQGHRRGPQPGGRRHVPGRTARLRPSAAPRQTCLPPERRSAAQL